MCLLTPRKNCCYFWSPKMIKIGSEAAVISAMNKIFTDSVITGCNFRFKLSLWRQIQNIGLTVKYKETEQVRLTSRISTALAYPNINKVEEGWLMIVQNVPHFCCLPQQP